MLLMVIIAAVTENEKRRRGFTIYFCTVFVKMLALIFWLIMGSILMREFGIFTYAAAWEIATLVTISRIAVDAREIPWRLRKPK